MKGKPVLVLANKQDREGAATEAAVSAALDLSALCDPSLVHVVPCTAKYLEDSGADAGAGRPRKDGRIDAGVRWLLDTVSSAWTVLDSKVQKESEEQRLEEERLKAERKARVEAAKKQRDAEEEAPAPQPRPDSGSKPAKKAQVAPAPAPSASSGVMPESERGRPANGPPPAPVTPRGTSTTADAKPESERGRPVNSVSVSGAAEVAAEQQQPLSSKPESERGRPVNSVSVSGAAESERGRPVVGNAPEALPSSASTVARPPRPESSRKDVLPPVRPPSGNRPSSRQAWTEEAASSGAAQLSTSAPASRAGSAREPRGSSSTAAVPAAPAPDIQVIDDGNNLTAQVEQVWRRSSGGLPPMAHVPDAAVALPGQV